MSGTVISTIIPIIFAPVMSRIFNPADFGVIGLYVSISMLLGVIAYSHYSHAIMLAGDKEEAKQVIWFTLFITACVSLLVFLITIVLYFFTTAIDHSAVGFWYMFMPLSVFLNGVNATLLIWANRVQQYRTLANNRVIQALLTIIIQISLGLLIKNETGLMIGLLGGQLISAVLLLKDFFVKETYSIGNPDKKEFKKIAIRHKNFFFYSTPSDFINSLINQAPFFLLQKFASISAVGSYAFTQRLLGLPQMFISSAITDVFKQKASVIYNAEGNCKSVFVKTFKSLGLLGLLPFLVLFAFAPQIIVFIFGEQWKEAGIYTQFLGIMYYCRFVISPLSYVYFIAGRLRENFYLHILFLFSTVAAFYIGNYFFEDRTMMILCYSIMYSIIYIIYLIRSYKFSCP